MLTKRALNKSINDFLNLLSGNGIHITRVIFYGSYANGTPNEYSDVDLAIWADEFSGFSLLDIELLLPAYRTFYKMSVRPYATGTTKEDDPFISEIERTGIELDFVPPNQG
jgi:predicted nucleotidyltransferase